MNNLINLENVKALEEIKEYKFTTAEGKLLTVTGELAQDLSVYFGMSTLGNKAMFEQAHRLRRIMDMPEETIKEKYSVKNGTTFITKFLGLAKGSISNYKKVADMFFTKDSSELKNPEIYSEYNFSQLQELTVYIVNYMDKKQADFDEAYEALSEIVQGEYPYTMSCAKMRSAIKKEFNTVEEPKTKTAETKTTEITETAETETETAETETETETETAETNKVPTKEVIFAILNRAKSAREAFDENGNYRGDDVVNHFRDTLDFIIEALQIK